MVYDDHKEAGRDAPQNWEALAARSPSSWYDYARADGLERWTAEQDEALDRDVVETTRRIEGLDQKLRPMARRALGKSPSPAWRTILGALVVVAWDSARRMGGQRDACVARPRVGERTSFSGLRAALEFAVYRQPLLGLVPRRLEPALDRPRDIAARMKARAAGCDVRAPRTTRTGRGEPKGVAAVDLRLDVLGAISASGIGALELWLVVANVVGELRPRARRTAHGVEEALVRARPGELAERLVAVGAVASDRAVRAAIEAARSAIELALETRGLIPLAASPADAETSEPIEAIEGLPLPAPAFARLRRMA